MIGDHFTKKRTNPSEFREVGVLARAKKSNGREQEEDTEGGRRVAEGATKRARKFAAEEIANPASALRISAIDPAVRANHQAIEIIDEPRVARFGTRNRQVRGRAAIDAPQFAHLFAMQFAQRHPIEQLQQLLESFPDVLALVDELVDWHREFSILDCRF